MANIAVPVLNLTVPALKIILHEEKKTTFIPFKSSLAVGVVRDFWASLPLDWPSTVGFRIKGFKTTVDKISIQLEAAEINESEANLNDLWLFSTLVEILRCEMYLQNYDIGVLHGLPFMDTAQIQTLLSRSHGNCSVVPSCFENLVPETKIVVSPKRTVAKPSTEADQELQDSWQMSDAEMSASQPLTSDEVGFLIQSIVENDKKTPNIAQKYDEELEPKPAKRLKRSRDEDDEDCKINVSN